ncbi:MAG: MATE family efflux transporter, partial [Lentisphaeria bacterium]
MRKYLHYFKEIIIFAIPVILGEVGQIFFGIGDILVAGRYSELVLASLGQACAFILPAMVLGLGITYAISPLKSRYLGSKRSVEKFFGSSLAVSSSTGIFLAAILILIASFIVPIIGYKHEPRMVPLIQSYLYIASFSIIPALIFAALKENLLAYGKTIFPNSLVITFNIFNIMANILLMFVFNLGIVGAAIATLLSRSLMAIILYFYTKKQLQVKHHFCKSITREIIATGIPIALGNAVTSTVFALVSILIGRMGVIPSATNNILINITSFTYMIPMALASVVAVKVGHAAGANKFSEVKRYAIFTLFIGLFSAFSMATIFATIPAKIMRIFTNMPEIINYGKILL